MNKQPEDVSKTLREKKRAINPKLVDGKKIIKIRTEINEMDANRMRQ
jgi:hypothetical protein